MLPNIILATLPIPRCPKQRWAGRDKAGKNGAGQQQNIVGQINNSITKPRPRCPIGKRIEPILAIQKPFGISDARAFLFN